MRWLPNRTRSLRVSMAAVGAVLAVSALGVGCDSLGTEPTDEAGDEPALDEVDATLGFQPIVVLKPNFVVKLLPGGSGNSALWGQLLVTNSGADSVITQIEWLADPFTPMATWTTPAWKPSALQLKACIKNAAPFKATGTAEGGSYTDVLSGRTVVNNVAVKSGGPAFTQNVTMFYWITANHPPGCGEYSKLADNNGVIAAPTENVTIKVTHKELGVTSVTKFTCHYKQSIGDSACTSP